VIAESSWMLLLACGPGGFTDRPGTLPVIRSSGRWTETQLAVRCRCCGAGSVFLCYNVACVEGVRAGTAYSGARVKGRAGRKARKGGDGWGNVRCDRVRACPCLVWLWGLLTGAAAGCPCMTGAIHVRSVEQHIFADAFSLIAYH
jgi:hypothetical protein